MNSTLTDRGTTEIAVGAPGSQRRLEMEWPRLIVALEIYGHSDGPELAKSILDGFITRRIPRNDGAIIMESARINSDLMSDVLSQWDLALAGVYAT